MRRVHTGIPGLDRLIQGGFPDGSVISLSGPGGVGKTLLGLQFLYGGLTQYDEPGILIQAGDFGSTLMWYEEMLGWNLGKFQERGKLVIYSFQPKDYEKFQPTKVQGEILGKLKNILVPMGAKRVVIDSITPLAETLDTKAEYRKSLYETISFLKENGITTIIISEGVAAEGGDPDVNTHRSIEEHLVDGVIKLRRSEEPNGEFRKELLISKMVATNFPTAWYPVTISERGFSVRPFL